MSDTTRSETLPDEMKEHLKSMYSEGEETEEQVAERSRRFLQNKSELEGYIEEYTEEWYRAKYPGFPDDFYPIFERFSNAKVNEPHGNLGTESASPCE
jgi:hypothetical protein